MIISLRFRYTLLILAFLVTDRAFTEFVFVNEDDGVLNRYNYVLVALSLYTIGRNYRYLKGLMRGWLWVLLAGLLALALESFAGWGSWLVYPHVFSKYTALLPIFAVYAYYARHGLPPLELLMRLLLLGLLTNLLVYHPEALSLSAFLDNERGFGSTSAMLVLLPTLYYLNEYLTRGGLLRLLVFFLGLGLIGFLQHRSVWLALGLALPLNGLLLALGRVEGARLTSSRLLPIVLIPLLLVISGGLAVLSDPQVRQKLDASVQDILHPDKQGTGSWRLRQYESYEPFLREYPVAGMRLKGFELPIQFYAPDSDQPVWPDWTGHHFHSFYVDRLFYFGGLGVLLVLLVPVLQLGRRLRQPVPLAPAAATLAVFALSMLVYGISYDWPPFFYAMLGLALAAAAPVWVPRPTLPAPAAFPRPVLSPLALLSTTDHATAAAASDSGH
ncbi:O-antigen ligase family protein [Hymenobacter algoricola]|uniref:O-antigen ligase-related domain-containing protein n=1 Tax=Hymenobacter algoricola TaxID=486267 RepID=A0ABP7MMH2_9BACT